MFLLQLLLLLHEQYDLLAIKILRFLRKVLLFFPNELLNTIDYIALEITIGLNNFCIMITK